MDILGGKHRSLATGVVTSIQPPFDAAFALRQFISYSAVHSKTLRAVFLEVVNYPLNTSKRREFSSFSGAGENNSLRVRLVKV
jgi:hypothetical protein